MNRPNDKCTFMDIRTAICQVAASTWKEGEFLETVERGLTQLGLSTLHR